MYNKEYYGEKKKKLEARYSINKDKVLQKISGFLNEFWEEQRNLQADFKELEEMIKSKSVKEVDKKCQKK